ncbi:MAG: Mov34/MPN/PAD-1 family protein [Acidobacteriota bacterium]|nr:Mov34/MPN/PAD-1 family protein [Acidobacteriota bacterium]
MKRIRLTVAPSVIRQFRRAAIEAFPREHCSFLIGHDIEGVTTRDVSIQELWAPSDVRKYATTTRMPFQHHWFDEAANHAKEAGMDLVGAVHSHPYPFEELKGMAFPDAAESESDSQYFGWNKLNGICLLTQRADLSVRARFRWWGPRVPVEMAR